MFQNNDLNASFTSDRTDYSYDSDLNFSALGFAGEEPQFDHHQQQQQQQPQQPAQQVHAHYYGFRTRHLSCIEENDSDSHHSAPYDVIKDADESFRKIVEQKSDSWDADDITTLDESRLYNIDSFEELQLSKTEEDENEEYWQSTVSEPLHRTHFKDKNGLPAIMTTSCYGALNSSFGSDASPVKSQIKIGQEPLYATPEKRKDHYATMSQSQSSSISIYGEQANLSLTSSIDLTSFKGNSTMELSVFSLDEPTKVGWCDDDVSEATAAKCISSAQADLQSIRRLLEHETSGAVCPSCRISFDKGKRRKLIDTCGHERCYSCMFRNDQCPMCMNSSLKDVDCSNTQGYDTGIGGSTSTIVSPLGSPQPQLRSQLRTNAAALSKYMQNRQESISPDFRYASVGKLPKSLGSPNGTASTLPTTTSTSTPATTTSSSGNDNNNSFGEIANAAAAAFATPPPTRRRFFNHKNLRSALTGGHRRTASNGCPIDSSSILSGGVGDGINLPSVSNEKQNEEELRTRLGLLLDAGKSSSSTNISPDSQTLTESSEYAEAINGRFKSKDYNKTFGSQFSVAAKDEVGSIAGKFKAFSINERTDAFDCPKLRKTMVRRSARSQLRNTGGIYKSSPVQAVQLALKPLFFEVPLQEPDPPFIGRQWLLRELSNILTTTETPGVLINGNPGTGKTALVLQLVEYSCFGRRKDVPYTETDGIYCQINIGHDRLKALASHIVGYHFCQADTNLTCLVPDFVHSLAAQLCQAPQLVAYRQYLINEPHLQNILCVKECIADAERVMRMAILEPLTMLKRSGKIASKTCVILIDALCEAEYHRPDHGHTIGTFLAKMTQYFPSWLKVVATVRTQMLELVKGLSFTKMTLDSWASNDLLQKDMLDYVTFRVNHSAEIQNNIAGTIKEHNSGQLKFIGHLQALTKGSFLYAKLILDLIERGQLVIKSTSYKVLPVSLAQIFLLHFNLRFPTGSSFEKASPILNVCLAALYPLTLNAIYYTICALKTDEIMSWDEFLQRFKLLDGFLVKRIDNTYMFFHPSFREWLIRRDDGESLKFLCDFRLGHAAIAFRLSRLQPPLDPEQTLELGHHILKAHIYRNSKGPPSPRDMQSFWIASVTDSISAALGSLRNVYNPNMKVSRLLLLAGASPHYQTEFMGDATILCIAAHEGIVPMVSLLLEFGADVERTNSQGCTPLILAAMKGHCDVLRLLVAAGSSLGQTDTTQRCALVHAARTGRLNVVKYLLASDWTPRQNSNDITLEKAVQQALIGAASQDHTTIVEDLLEMENVYINDIEPLSGETALTAAARNGCVDTVAVLLSRGAKVDGRNKFGATPLWLTVKEGHWAVAEKLLQNGAQIDEAVIPSKKTPLMIAAEEGLIGILELLIDRGASIDSEDSEGFTALSWACLRGRHTAAKCLIEKGCDKEHADNNGRTPLDLAAYQGSASLVQYLLDQGAKIEHIDVNGMRPLDRAIACRNIQVVQVFLKRGAKLGPTTWSMAMGKPEILVVLLNKLLEDGNVLYRKNRFQEAAHRYQYALKKIANIETLLDKNSVFTQLRANLLLNLSRCKRKLNELDESTELATQAIDQKPTSYEGYYARAKAKMEQGELNDALVDANEAMQKAAQSGVLPEVVEVLRRIQNELLVRINEATHGTVVVNGCNETESQNEMTDL